MREFSIFVSDYFAKSQASITLNHVDRKVKVVVPDVLWPDDHWDLTAAAEEAGAKVILITDQRAWFKF